MRTLNLLEDVEFHPERVTAAPLLVGESGRVLRFALRPGQVLAEHRAASSPVHIVVVRGEGMFAGGEGGEERLGPGAMVVFEEGEMHRIRALDDDLVFVAILHRIERDRTASPGRPG